MTASTMVICPSCETTYENDKRFCRRRGTQLHPAKTDSSALASPFSAARMATPVVLFLLWLSTIAYLRSSVPTRLDLWAQLGAALPDATILAIRFSRPLFLAPIGLATIWGLIAIEVTVRSKRTRLLARITSLGLWLAVTAFILIALSLPSPVQMR